VPTARFDPAILDAHETQRREQEDPRLCPEGCIANEKETHADDHECSRHPLQAEHDIEPDGKMQQECHNSTENARHTKNRLENALQGSQSTFHGRCATVLKFLREVGG